jgi:hypothetical protein
MTQREKRFTHLSKHLTDFGRGHKVTLLSKYIFLHVVALFSSIIVGENLIWCSEIVLYFGRGFIRTVNFGDISTNARRPTLINITLSIK